MSTANPKTPSATSSRVVPHTFIFADMSGFTALTEAHGDEAAADLVAAFSEAVGPRLRRRRAEEVKTIGDALMIRGQDTADSIKLLTDATRAAIGSGHSFNLRERGRVQLRNVPEPILLFAALRRGVIATGELPVDPVCRMAVEPESAAGSLRHCGTVYFFCSLECAGHFAADPERYMR